MIPVLNLFPFLHPLTLRLSYPTLPHSAHLLPLPPGSWEITPRGRAGLYSMAPDFPHMWVGAVNEHVAYEEWEGLKKLLQEEWNCHPVFMPPDMLTHWMVGFSNGVLWPVMHYMLPHDHGTWAKEYGEAWKAYNAVNVLVGTVPVGQGYGVS